MTKKSNPCNTDCCKPESPLDCCAIPYQRLEKLRAGWSIIAAAGNNLLPLTESSGLIVGPKNRAGDSIAVPVAELFEQADATDGTGLVTVSGGVIDPVLNAAYYAYLFVNTHRYLAFQECGKLDQVIGWYVDFQTGQLELFQGLCELNLPINVNRLALSSLPDGAITNTQRKQLHALNKFYKVSKMAVELIGSNQKEEGNIIQVSDKCGQKWLLAVNVPSLTADTCANGCGAFVIVAIPLC
jgi:hypothetical protein